MLNAVPGRDGENGGAFVLAQLIEGHAFPFSHRGGRLSQRHGLCQHSLSNAGTKAALGNDIHRYLQQDSRSSSSPLRSNSVRPGSISTRKSTSLFSSLSPRATEPKTRTFRAPRCAATRKMSARLLSRSPEESWRLSVQSYKG